MVFFEAQRFSILIFNLFFSLVACAKVFNFNEVQFIFSFVAYAFGIIYKKPLPNPSSWRFTPCFLLRVLEFYLLHLALSSLSIYFLYLVWGRDPTSFSSLWIYSFLSQFKCLGTLVENQLTINVKVYFWTLSSIPLIYMSILVLVPHCPITVVL